MKEYPESEIAKIWKINIPDAVKLIAGECYIEDDITEADLIKIIEDGNLEAFIKRDFKGNIIADLTYIDLTIFQDWLESCGYEIGDHIKSYLNDEVELFGQIDEEVAFRRQMIKQRYNYDAYNVLEATVLNGRVKFSLKDIDTASKEELYEACRLVIIEHNKLLQEIESLKLANQDKHVIALQTTDSLPTNLPDEVNWLLESESANRKKWFEKICIKLKTTSKTKSLNKRAVSYQIHLECKKILEANHLSLDRLPEASSIEYLLTDVWRNKAWDQKGNP